MQYVAEFVLTNEHWNKASFYLDIYAMLVISLKEKQKWFKLLTELLKINVANDLFLMSFTFVFS